MLVDLLAEPASAGAAGFGTESTVLGPFYVADSPEREYGASIVERPSGGLAAYTGRVTDTDGNPIAGATLDIWQNADDMLYAVQNPDRPPPVAAGSHPRHRWRARLPERGDAHLRRRQQVPDQRRRVRGQGQPGPYVRTPRAWRWACSRRRPARPGLVLTAARLPAEPAELLMDAPPGRAEGREGTNAAPLGAAKGGRFN